MHSLISYAFRFISIPANVSATIWDIAQQAKMLNRNWFNNDSSFVLSGWGLAVAPCVLQNRCQLMRLTPVHSHIRYLRSCGRQYIFSASLSYTIRSMTSGPDPEPCQVVGLRADGWVVRLNSLRIPCMKTWSFLTCLL